MRAIFRAKNKFYYVGALPLLIVNYCNLSDECYLCYELSYPVKNQDDLFSDHGHIRASINDLTRQRKKIYKRVKTLLGTMKLSE